MARVLVAVDFLIVGLGGALGAMARHGAGLALASMGRFPYATLAVNVVGCFAIGVLMSLVEARGAHGGRLHLLLGVGLMGGLTTFSAFGYDTLRMLREGAWLLALLNIGVNVGVGLGAAALGWWLGSGLGAARGGAA
ncbi:MAG: fluoride efflux transporter CrcB [Phycisphaerales bacterium]|jgi:CrcB protein|nr:fluoride efflux transporter CrcB [Phycisphaerales bacterium]